LLVERVEVLVTHGELHVLEIQVLEEDSLLTVYKVSHVTILFLHPVMEKVETLMVTITAVLVGVIIVMGQVVEHTVVQLVEVKDTQMD
jgi:hypothetical protein